MDLLWMRIKMMGVIRRKQWKGRESAADLLRRNSTKTISKIRQKGGGIGPFI